MKKLSERMSDQYYEDAGKDLVVETPPFPRNMLVELSNACNHSCIFCANSYATRKMGRLDSTLLRRLMSEAYELGTREIGFYTTGEPFVHKDLPQFTSWAREIGYEYIYISTNGAMATPERAKAVIDAGMNSIKFSINAGSKETYAKIHGHDEWDKVIDNLRFISEYRKTLDRHLALFISFAVTNITRHEIESFTRDISPLVDEISFRECTTQFGQMPLVQSLLGVSEAPPPTTICKMPFNRLHITCEGYLTACCTDYQNYLVVADLNKVSLTEGWASDPFQKLRRRHMEKDLAGTLCGNCWLGRKDHIEAILPDLATTIEYSQFYQDVAQEVAKSIK